jgi:L-serine deaminase
MFTHIAGKWSTVMSDKLQIAQTVATHLFATEDAIDAAIKEAAGLAGYLPVARAEVGVSAAVGQPAIEQVIATMLKLSEARRSIVEAHQSLAESGKQGRVPVRNFGGFVDKPCYHRDTGPNIVAVQ